jgi:photosystem II stability/assembly factor-like uncharacterized protein
MADVILATRAGVFRWQPGGSAQAEDGPGLAFLAAAGDVLYGLAADNALWRREADGRWVLVNPRATTAAVWSFAADPRQPGRLYLGLSPAMVLWSDDGGQTWAACESIRLIPGYDRWTFPPPPHIPHVRWLAPDPAFRGGLYFGAEEGGVYRTRDGGATWASLNEGLYWDVHTVTPAPDGSARLYATTGAGFHRSDDGGQHWRRLAEGLDRRYTVAFAVHPTAIDQLLMAAAATPPPGWRAGANAALYRSDDGGEHWQMVSDGVPTRFDTMIGVLAFLDGRWLAASNGDLYASEDRRRWERVLSGLPTIHGLAAA